MRKSTSGSAEWPLSLGNAAVVLGMGAFWICNLISIRLFPTEFDWRYIPLTTLLSPQDNPGGAAWSKAAVALCGISVVIWSIGLVRGWTRPVIVESPVGLYALGAGGAMMTCAGLLPLKLPGLEFEHQITSTFAFAGISVGLARLAFRVTSSRVERNPHVSRLQRTVYAALSAGVIVIPIVIAVFADAYVFHVYKQLHSVGLNWRDAGVPLYLSWSLWEWITLGILSLCLFAFGVAGDLRAWGAAPTRLTPHRLFVR